MHIVVFRGGGSNKIEYKIMRHYTKNKGVVEKIIKKLNKSLRRRGEKKWKVEK